MALQISRSIPLICLIATAALTSLTLTAATLQTDLEYGRAGQDRLLLDVSVPDGTGPFPVAILVHGGGWSGGDKSGSEKLGSGNDITPWFAPLQAASFTYFSINYRHAPLHRWPAGFEDVQTAIRWVKAHAAHFKGDPGRIVLFGHSAGGHLACLAATTASADSQVQAVVGFAAVTDLEADTARRGGLSPSLQALFDLPKAPNPASLVRLRECSPISHVHPGLPPFLLVHGDADQTVPLAMSVAFQAKLKAAGVRCDLLTIHGAPHRLVGWEQFDQDYFAQIIQWLRLTLNRAPEPLTSAARSIRLDERPELGTNSVP